MGEPPYKRFQPAFPPSTLIWNGRSITEDPARTPGGDDLAGTRNQGKPKNPRYAGPEPRIGKIECHPAPDAEDRLRRLFTLLAKHISREGSKKPEQQSSLEDGSAEL